MKNKKAIFILLPLVVSIWGLVIYRLFDFSNDDAVDTGPIVQPEKQLPEMIQRDTFTITANYRDPFLGKFQKKKIVVAQVKQKPKKRKHEPPPPLVKWPAVTYGGVIKNRQTKEQIAIIRVNEKELLMAINDVSQGISLKRIFNKDSIEVSYLENNKIIYKR